MKQILILFFFLFFLAEKNFAQEFKDSIITNGHDTILCHITQATENFIYYQYRSKKGKIESTEKNIERVLRFNIYKDTSFNTKEETKSFHADSSQALTIPLATRMFDKGQRDAKKYYKGYSEAGNGTLFTGLLSPLLGLIPAISCSSTQPKEKNLGFPSTELMKDNDYYNGYSQEAKKIKRTRVWGNWGVAFGINLIVYSLVILPQTK